MVVTLAAVASLGRLFDSTDYLAPLADHRARRPRLRDRAAPDPARPIAVVRRGRRRAAPWSSAGPLPRHHLPRPAHTEHVLDAPAQDLRDAWTQFGEVGRAGARAPRASCSAPCIAVWVAAWVADWAAFRLGLRGRGGRSRRRRSFVFAALLGADRHRTVGHRVLHRRRARLRPPAPGGRQVTTGTWVGNGRRQGPPGGGGRRAGHGRARGRVRRVRRPAVARSRRRGDARLARRRDRRRHPGDGQPAGRHPQAPGRPVRRRGVHGAGRPAVVLAAHRARRVRRHASGPRAAASREADGDLPGDAGRADVDADRAGLRHQRRSQAIWLPAAFEPLDVQTDGTDVRYDTESSTLIVDNDLDTSDGVNYRVTSARPQLRRRPARPERRRRPPGPDPRPLPAAARATSPSRSRTWPSAIMPARRRTPTSGPACSRTASGSNFTYDLSGVPRGPQRGRHRGLPRVEARLLRAVRRHVRGDGPVAWASPPGWRSASRPGERRRGQRRHRYIVRGRNAHAWPEVWINQAGWVPFEPTPGRGAPGAEAWTGVAEQQDDRDPIATTGRTVDPQHRDHPDDRCPTRPRRDPTRSTPVGSGTHRRRRPAVAARPGRDRRWRAAVLAVAAWVGLLAGGPDRSGRGCAGAAPPPAPPRCALAWLESAEAVGRVAPPLRPAETHAEFAARVRPVIGPASRPLQPAGRPGHGQRVVRPGRRPRAGRRRPHAQPRDRPRDPGEPRTAAAPARLVRPPPAVPDVARERSWAVGYGSLRKRSRTRWPAEPR